MSLFANTHHAVRQIFLRSGPKVCGNCGRHGDCLCYGSFRFCQLHDYALFEAYCTVCKRELAPVDMAGKRSPAVGAPLRLLDAPGTVPFECYAVRCRVCGEQPLIRARGGASEDAPDDMMS